MNSKERAIYMLETAARYLTENEREGVCDHTTIYDDAECDGTCLAEDLRLAANELQHEGESI